MRKGGRALPCSPSFGGGQHRAEDRAQIPLLPVRVPTVGSSRGDPTAPDLVPRPRMRWTRGPRAALLGCRAGPFSRMSPPQSLVLR